jgi:hypothetical protein
MSGPDCEKCGEYFLGCNCEVDEKTPANLKEYFKSIVFLLMHAKDEETRVLIPVFTKIYTRIMDGEQPEELERRRLPPSIF